MDRDGLAERIWFGEGRGAAALRGVLAPLGVAYRAAAAARGALYDAGVMPTRQPPIPVMSVGNLTVGGTGKTPVAAWSAAQLAARGARPAIVLRGYGADEPAVHRVLNPQVPVIVAPDRARGVADAAARGCDVAVLDDAFQHRRVARVVDLVLVSADRWTPRQRLLPAGPWRESLHALRRATCVAVTRKAAADDAVAAVRRAIAAVAPAVPTAIVRLVPDELRALADDRRAPAGSLRGRRVLAIAGIGDPGAFVRQLEALGARVELVAFPDHHAFTPGDVGALAARAAGADVTVCTLKDAVKLAATWPRASPPVWYVSQRIEVDAGGHALDGAFTAMVAARVPHTSPPGPSSPAT